MYKVGFDKTLRKSLTTSFVIGACGGLFIGMMKRFKSQYSTFELFIYLLLLVILGTAIGIASLNYTQKHNIKHHPTDKEEDYKIANQKSFFITLLIMVITHFINAYMNGINFLQY